MKRVILINFFVFICNLQAQFQPLQPDSGYGGKNYEHNNVIQLGFEDYVSGKSSYLYLPSDPELVSGPIIIFLHGYGAYNPAVYGRWINHLVRKGNIVVFPRYQTDFTTRPEEFTVNTVRITRNLIDTLLSNEEYPIPYLDKLMIIGHSYGGVIAANLAHNWDEYEIPKPAGILLACPGTNGFDSGRISSYSNMDSSMNIICFMEKNDVVVDSAFSKEVFDSTITVSTKHKNLVIHHPDNYGYPEITSTHSEPCSPDLEYDNGERNVTINLALLSQTDANDFYNYWKLTDALIDYVVTGDGYTYAFGNTPEQRFMGLWSDNVPVRELEIRPSEINSIKSTLQNISNFILYQNYPNPFNPKTNILYWIPKRSYVSIKIYDLLGREVITLVNQDQEAKYYNILWDAKDKYGNNVSSGMYFYRIIAESENNVFIKTKKLLLLR